MSFSDQRSASSPLEVLHEHVIQSLARKIPVDTQQIATLRVLQRDFSDRIADILACDIPPSDTFDQQVWDMNMRLCVHKNLPISNYLPSKWQSLRSLARFVTQQVLWKILPSDLVHSRKGFVLSYRASVLSIIPLSIVEASPAPRQTPSVRPSDVSSLPATTGMKKVSRSRLATRSSTPTLPEPSEKEYDQGVDPDALHIEAIRNILMGSQDTQAKLFALVDFFTQKDIIGMDATPSEEYKTFMKEIQLLAAEHMGNAESFLDYLRHTTGRKYTLTNRILISNSTASRWGSTLDDSFKRVFKETRAVAPRFLSEKGLIFCMPPSHSERLGSSTVVVWHIAQLSDTQEPTVTNTSDDEEAIEGEVEPATI